MNRFYPLSRPAAADAGACLLAPSVPTELSYPAAFLLAAQRSLDAVATSSAAGGAPFAVPLRPRGVSAAAGNWICRTNAQLSMNAFLSFCVFALVCWVIPILLGGSRRPLFDRPLRPAAFGPEPEGGLPFAERPRWEEVPRAALLLLVGMWARKASIVGLAHLPEPRLVSAAENALVRRAGDGVFLAPLAELPGMLFFGAQHPRNPTPLPTTRPACHTQAAASMLYRG